MLCRDREGMKHSIPRDKKEKKGSNLEVEPACCSSTAGVKIVWNRNGVARTPCPVSIPFLLPNKSDVLLTRPSSSGADFLMFCVT